MVVTVVRVASYGLSGGSAAGDRTAALIYFIVACVTCVGALFAGAWLSRTAFTRGGATPTVLGGLGDAERVAKEPSDTTSDETDPLVPAITAEVAAGVRMPDVLRKCWPEALALLLVMFVTLTLFPGVVVMIPSVSGNPSWMAWFPIVLIVRTGAAPVR
jgi:hypothetical protein